MSIRNRITEMKMVKASELIPNEKNWRTHNDGQRKAMEGILNEVGYVDALLAYHTEDGKLKLLDGHLRAETTPDEEVPVIIVDLTDDEADKVLATFDPISAMAGVDDENLHSLLEELTVEDESLKEMLNTLAAQNGLNLDEWEGRDPVDPDSMPQYDPDKETVSIRINEVLATDREDIEKRIADALEGTNYKHEAF